MNDFLPVMKRLRAECAWKRGQTHASIARYLIEEAHEAVEAIELGDDEHLREELGDLLLQVYFHSVMAEERGAFTLEDVLHEMQEKMVRRNPHVFDPVIAEQYRDATADDLVELWNSIKAGEKGKRQRTSALEGVPTSLPALLYALKAMERSGPQPGGALPPRSQPTAEQAGRIGESLLAIVRESHALGVDPEQALREAVRTL